MAEYILKKEPIITSYGVLYRNQQEVVNPLVYSYTNLLKNLEALYKKQMYEYPKGSELI